MTRFMLPLRQAVDLVLYAFEHGNPGDIFVRQSARLLAGGPGARRCRTFLP